MIAFENGGLKRLPYRTMYSLFFCGTTGGKTLKLLIYWVEGNRAPKLFDYYPTMKAMFNVRRNQLLRHEIVYVTREKKIVVKILS